MKYLIQKIREIFIALFGSVTAVSELCDTLSDEAWNMYIGSNPDDYDDEQPQTNHVRWMRFISLLLRIRGTSFRECIQKAWEQEDICSACGGMFCDSGCWQMTGPTRCDHCGEPEYDEDCSCIHQPAHVQYARNGAQITCSCGNTLFVADGDVESSDPACTLDVNKAMDDDSPCGEANTCDKASTCFGRCE